MSKDIDGERGRSALLVGGAIVRGVTDLVESRWGRTIVRESARQRLVVRSVLALLGYLKVGGSRKFGVGLCVSTYVIIKQVDMNDRCKEDLYRGTRMVIRSLHCSAYV